MRCRFAAFVLLVWVPVSAPAIAVPRDWSMTISGGVSLGAYSAGFTYLMTEYSKRVPEAGRVRLLTGASAGSINALIGALNSCGAWVYDPRDFVGYQIWTETGYQALFRPDDVTSVSFFSRDALHVGAEKIRARWQQGLPSGCDVVLGVSTTRVKTHPIRVQRNLYVPRQSEHFAFRIQGQGSGRAPDIENYVDPDKRVESLVIPFDNGEPFNALRDVLFASSAFPTAFPPQSLSFCATSTTGVLRNGVVCPPDSIRKEEFVDGGVFDNSPLRMAHQLAGDGLVQNAMESRWRDLRALPTKVAPADVSFFYVDPMAASYPVMRDEAPPSQVQGLMPFLSGLAGGFVETARSRELYALIEDDQVMGEVTRLSERNLPVVSSHLFAFLGFFDRAFREFDFALGMYDAWHYLLRRMPYGPNQISPYVFFDPHEVSEGWVPFACLLSVMEADQADLSPACEAAPPKFRIMLQVALDRLFSQCRGYKPDDLSEYQGNALCMAATKGEDPPRLVPLGPDMKWQRQRSETHFTHSMRLLTGYRFPFSDLGLSADEAEYGRVKLRRKMLGMLNALADKQDYVSRVILLTAGRLSLNAIAYEPPKNWIYVVAGTGSEVGASVLPFSWNQSWARLNVGLQSKGILTLLTSARDEFSFTPAAGLEFEPPFFSTPLWQIMSGVRVGYQFANRDDFGTGSCTNAAAFGSGKNCSQLVLQNYWALGLLERLRLQVTLEFFPDPPAFDRANFDVLVGFGAHFF